MKQTMTRKTTIKTILLRVQDQRTIEALQSACKAQAWSVSQAIEFAVLKPVVGAKEARRVVERGKR